LFFWFGGKRGSIKANLIKTLMILGILPLSYAPNLVIAESWASFRSMIALSSTWVVLLIFSGKGITGALSRSRLRLDRLNAFGIRAWVLLALVMFVYSSASYIVFPAYFEHRYIRLTLTSLPLKPGDTIYLWMPSYTDYISPYYYGDEFGVPATTKKWGIFTLPNLILREIGLPPNQVKLTMTDDPAKVPLGNGTYLINLHKIRCLQLPLKMHPVERAKMIVDRLFYGSTPADSVPQDQVGSCQ
jgi:hypothetical protein